MTRPSWLRFVTDDRGRDVPMAAVALATPTGEHVGVVFRDEDNEPRFLHLAFHHKLTNDPLPAEGVAWVTPAIPEELLPSFAAMCDRIWKRHGKMIPYGFAYNRTRFLHDGTLELGLDEHGLTCATFVLAVARSAGIELLSWEEWPTRPEDDARFDELVEMLRKHCRDAEHVAAVASEKVSVRFRPKEVAGASAVSPPCRFSDAVNAAEKITLAYLVPSTETFGDRVSSSGVETTA